MTGIRLPNKTLMPNFLIKKLISEMQESMMKSAKYWCGVRVGTYTEWVYKYKVNRCPERPSRASRSCPCKVQPVSYRVWTQLQRQSMCSFGCAVSLSDADIGGRAPEPAQPVPNKLPHWLGQPHLRILTTVVPVHVLHQPIWKRTGYLNQNIADRVCVSVCPKQDEPLMCSPTSRIRCSERSITIYESNA